MAWMRRQRCGRDAQQPWGDHRCRRCVDCGTRRRTQRSTRRPTRTDPAALGPAAALGHQEALQAEADVAEAKAIVRYAALRAAWSPCWGASGR